MHYYQYFKAKFDWIELALSVLELYSVYSLIAIVTDFTIICLQYSIDPFSLLLNHFLVNCIS